MRRWQAWGLLLLAACGPGREDAKRAGEEAWAEFRRGNLRAAERRLERALGSPARPVNSPAACKLLLLRAEVWLAQGRAQEALPLVERPVCGEAESAELKFRRLVARADALSKLDRNPEALAILEEAGPAARQARLADTWLQSQVLKAMILLRLNRAGEAEPLLQRVIEQAAREGNHYQRGAALINLSLSLIRQSRFDKAAPYARLALEAGERAGAGRIVALAHNHLGIVYARLGDFERAEQQQSLAVQSFRQIDDRRNLMEALGELGNLQVLRGNPEAGVPSFEQAIAIARELKANQPGSRWAGNLARVLVDAGRWEEAERWNNEARKLREQAGDRRGLVFLKEAAAAIAAGRKQYAEAERLLRETIAEAEGAPYLVWQAHARLGGLYSQTGRRAEANAEYERALEAIEGVRAELPQNEFRVTFLARLIGFFQDYVDQLVEQGETERALQVADYSRARVLAERLGSGRETIAAAGVSTYRQFARRTGAALLSYWVAPKRSFVWVVRADGIHHAVLPGEKEITHLAASFRSLVEEQLRDPLDYDSETARRLAGALLSEPLKHLPRNSRVYLVPDGPLHRINFETLPVPGTRRYLVEDWTLAVAPSLALLAGGKIVPGSTPGRVMLIGAAEAQGADYPALPKAGEEIAAIQKRLAAPAEVLAGPKATPQSYRQSQPERFSLIHFAAHAETNRQSPLDSAVILSSDGGGFKLYARDVMESKLTAGLVTISACRSAGARAYGGEGMVGLAWAFLKAGARAVIAGLWDVSDSATAALVDRLYAGLASGQAPEEALRAAKLALLQGPEPLRKPFYWGPLEIYVRAGATKPAAR